MKKDSKWTCVCLQRFTNSVMSQISGCGFTLQLTVKRSGVVAGQLVKTICSCHSVSLPQFPSHTLQAEIRQLEQIPQTDHIFG